MGGPCQTQLFRWGGVPLVGEATAERVEDRLGDRREVVRFCNTGIEATGQQLAKIAPHRAQRPVAPVEGNNSAVPRFVQVGR